MLGGRRGFVDSTPARETEEARRRDPGGDTEWSRKETRLQAQRPTSDGPKVGETARLLQSGPSDRLDNGRVAILPAQPRKKMGCAPPARTPPCAPRSMVATHPRFASEGPALFRFLLGSATAQEARSAPIARLGSAPIQRPLARPLRIPSPEPPRPPLPAVPPLPRARAVFPVTCHFCLPAGRPPVDHGRLRPTAPPRASSPPGVPAPRRSWPRPGQPPLARPRLGADAADSPSSRSPRPWPLFAASV